MRRLAVPGLVILGAWGVTKLFRLWDASGDIRLDVADIKPEGINLSGLVIGLTPVVVNPTNARLRVRQPYIEIYNEKDSLLAANEPSQQEITIAPHQTVNLNRIRLRISLIALASNAIDLIQQFAKTKKVNKTIKVKVLTAVNGINLPAIWVEETI